MDRTTMRRLLLLRHAKTEPHTADDHGRDLTPRGRSDATEMGRYLASSELVPDMALSSTSLRTRETWRLASEAFPQPVAALFDRALYQAGVSTILDLVRQTLPTVRSLLVIGHNPGIAELMGRVATSGDANGLIALCEKVPTSSLAVIDFDEDGWAEIGKRGGRLERFVTPRSLGLPRPG